jgi:hypothetical protein
MRDFVSHVRTFSTGIKSTQPDAQWAATKLHGSSGHPLLASTRVWNGSTHPEWTVWRTGEYQSVR